MFNPPTRYVNKVLDSKKFAKYDLSLPKNVKGVAFDELPDVLSKDGVEIHKVRVMIDWLSIGNDSNAT